MRLFYSNHATLTNGKRLNIFVNGGKTGEVTASEMWINTISGNYKVYVVARDGEDEIELEKGIDMNNFAVADTAVEARMMYLTSDAYLIIVEGDSDCEIDVKVIY